jgi:hypothetical protein
MMNIEVEGRLKTRLTSPLFIELPFKTTRVSDHIYMCKGINIYILSTILGFGTVLKE